MINLVSAFLALFDFSINRIENELICNRRTCWQRLVGNISFLHTIVLIKAIEQLKWLLYVTFGFWNRLQTRLEDWHAYILQLIYYPLRPPSLVFEELQKLLMTGVVTISYKN